MIHIDNMQKYIEDYYAQHHSEMVLTRRVKERLSEMIIKNIKDREPTATEVNAENVDPFLEKEEVLNFIKEREPNTTPVPDEVMEHIQEYFNDSKWLSKYKLVDVCRLSNNKQDDYLYCIVAEKAGKFSCWSSWNEKTLSLSLGHYDYETKEAAFGVLKDVFNDITMEPQKYGIELTVRSFQEEGNRQIKQHENEMHVQMRRRGGR